HEPINIVVQVPMAERSEIERLGDLPIQSTSGVTLPLRELGRFERVPEEDTIFRKDLRAIEFVVADVGGNLAAPIYGMFQIQDILDQKGYRPPDGVVPVSYWTQAPTNDRLSSWEWAGEWTVTYETFRDMGAAFAVALVLIYILVVWEFGNFRIPLVIMAPIPLTLLGIIPAHFIMFSLGKGGEFTATSMIGWIALAGIIVRNSILLVDFSIHEVQKGVPVAEAVIRACKTRTRPILITALALVAGSSVIFTDPIFQGMAISLASGVLVSTVLTLIVIPLGCVEASKDLCEVAVATAHPGLKVPCANGEANGGGYTAAPAPDTRPKPAKSGLLIRIWMGLFEVLSMAFYLVRGILLLVIDLVKGLFKPKKTKRVASPPPPAPPAAATGGGAPSPPVSLAPAAGGEAPPVPPAAQAEAGTEPQAKLSSEAPAPSPAYVLAAASVPVQVSAQVPAAASPAAQEPVRAPVAIPAKKAEVTARKKTPAPARKAPAPVKKAEVSAANLIQKKSPRRGIRLKNDTDEGPGHD
ncbi:MAG: efflux RND transporter permease subunit, partial [Chromatiaceae bacterium]